MTVEEVVFPEEMQLSTNSIISQAQIFIPSSIILHQFEIEGTAQN